MNFHFGTEALTSPPSWYEPYFKREKIKPVRVTVKRDKKLLTCLALPKISTSNMRSLIPKVNNFKTDVLEREINLCLLSEIWEQKGKKKHMSEITKMLELNGLKYISTPRSVNKRGGGCAIVVNLSTFTLKKIEEVHIPKNLEVVYGLVRPKNLSSNIKEIIAVAFYSPPKSRKKNELLDHIITTCQILLSKYPNAGIIIGGDRNEMSVAPLINSIPRAKQIVTQPTCNGKVLDVIVTNLHEFYEVPEIVSAVPADNPNSGVPSDHCTAVAAPFSSVSDGLSNEYISKTTRPLPDSGIRSFGQWIVQESWDSVKLLSDPSEQAILLDNVVSCKLDEHLPQKSLKITNKDKKWINAELKKLDRLKKREWTKRGKSAKYLELKKKFDIKYREASENYLKKNVTELIDDDPGKAYATLKRMGSQPGDNLDDTSFEIIKHLEQNLTNSQSVEMIAEHFTKISQEYPPLSVSRLSESVQKKLADRHLAKPPFISKYSVEKVLRKAKKSKSGSNGDLPKVIVNEFCQELAEPLSIIYNNIVKTGKWPDKWKVEHGIPLKKVDEPYSEEDLRIISLTPLYSKVFEKIVLDWLLDALKDKLDPFQYGGQKGNAVSHYLIDFINFVQYNQDIKDIHAVLAVAIDFSKAFNRQNHHILIELLSALDVPGWLLQIVIGFLEDRQIEVHFKGEKSAKKHLPGGGPQGTVLGMFLFLILINGAGFKDTERNTGEIICNPAINKRKPLMRMHAKWIDDMTIAEAVSLKDCLIENPSLQHPLPFHERTGHSLPHERSQVQALLTEVFEYTKKHEMKINESKTNVILFNRSKKFDFAPNLSIGNSSPLNVVEELKILGITIRSDLSWSTNTRIMCGKAYSRLWILRRLKPLGVQQADLLNVYEKQIRCIVEFASPVWTGGLTKSEVAQIERVQKAAFAIILGYQYTNYAQACATLSRLTLESRRLEINLKFAKKCYASERYNHWFHKNTSTCQMETRSKKFTLAPVQSRTKIFEKSPISYLTQLLREGS